MTILTKIRNKIKGLPFFIGIIGCISCGGSYESQDREALILAFKKNFGFLPPRAIQEIKFKSWGMYDTSAHWMAFTYDAKVVGQIIAQDRSLEVALQHSSECSTAIENITENAYRPEWLQLPNENTVQIYYKKDFLHNNFSEYYLWSNTETKMTFLYVHYFD